MCDDAPSATLGTSRNPLSMAPQQIAVRLEVAKVVRIADYWQVTLRNVRSHPGGLQYLNFLVLIPSLEVIVEIGARSKAPN